MTALGFPLLEVFFVALVAGFGWTVGAGVAGVLFSLGRREK